MSIIIMINHIHIVTLFYKKELRGILSGLT